MYLRTFTGTRLVPFVYLTLVNMRIAFKSSKSRVFIGLFRIRSKALGSHWKSIDENIYENRQIGMLL